MKAWHFLNSNWEAYNRFKVEVGKTYTHEGPLVPCESGLHASVAASDAASFYKGVVVTRVECGEEIKEHTKKFVCRERTALWGYDATDELRAHARWCALEVAHLWKMPEVVRQYLETGDETLRTQARIAAADCAAAAAYAASSYSSYSAAYASAAAACADAAYSTACADAAAAAVASAASAAVGKSFSERANTHLEGLLLEGARKRGLITGDET